MAFYSELGVSPHASPASCRKAFRRMALQCHPDKSDHPLADEQFKRLERAWRVLSDPAAREAYDSLLRRGVDEGLEEERREEYHYETDFTYTPPPAPYHPHSAPAHEGAVLANILCFVFCAALLLLALYSFMPAYALFPGAIRVSNRRFGRYSLRDSFQKWTSELIADHIANQSWVGRLAAAVVRTHTPYLLLVSNRSDLQLVPCASLGCPKRSFLLRTPRRVGQKTHSIFTFIQAASITCLTTHHVSQHSLRWRESHTRYSSPSNSEELQRSHTPRRRQIPRTRHDMPMADWIGLLRAVPQRLHRFASDSSDLDP